MPTYGSLGHSKSAGYLLGMAGAGASRRSPERRPRRSNTQHDPSPRATFLEEVAVNVVCDELAETSADVILHMLLPDCECLAAVIGRMQRERVRTAADLVRLDKQDLTELGLGMVDRSKVLAWSKAVLPAPETMLQPQPAAAPAPAAASMTSTGTAATPRGAVDAAEKGKQQDSSTGRGPLPAAPAAAATSTGTVVKPRRARLDRSNSKQAFQFPRAGSPLDMQDEIHQHLEDLEQKADFWCSLAHSWLSHTATRWRRGLEGGVNNGELREGLLESIFDLSQERVREVYDTMVSSDASSETWTAQDRLRWGLEKYGIQLNSRAALRHIIEAVAGPDPDPDTMIQLAEFETIISRLTLAQIVMFLEAEGRGLEENGESGSSSNTEVGNEVGKSTTTTTTASTTTTPHTNLAPTQRVPIAFTVCDYTARKAMDQRVRDAQIRRFFFGHRPQPEGPMDQSLVRWMHLRGYNLNMLLGLTVKYNLHPLAVEDTVDQAPSKADRYGPHYFTTIEGLTLMNKPEELGSEPVLVGGYHVAVFCAGPPLLDTVITIAQEDRSFAEDWPNFSAELAGSGELTLEVDRWGDKIRERLHTPLSRVRERRADFLVYMVLDTITDEIMAVLRAYRARLSFLEGRLAILGHRLPRTKVGEVVIIRRQLNVVIRRVRGISRVVKKFIEDPDIATGLGAYLQDIVEHLEEVWDDCDRLGGKCGALCEAYDRAVDREREHRARQQAEQARRHELRRADQADRQNNILFILAVVTTVFAPIQFLGGVYGMNFVDENGRPTIPELTWKGGYAFFWRLVGGYLAVCAVIAVGVYCCLRRKQLPADERDYQDFVVTPSDGTLGGECESPGNSGSPTDSSNGAGNGSECTGESGAARDLLARGPGPSGLRSTICNTVAASSSSSHRGGSTGSGSGSGGGGGGNTLGRSTESDGFRAVHLAGPTGISSGEIPPLLEWPQHDNLKARGENMEQAAEVDFIGNMA